MSKASDKNKGAAKPATPYPFAIAAGYAPEVAAKIAGLEAVPAMTPELEANIAAARAEWDGLPESERVAIRAAMDPENQPHQGGPAVDAAAKALEDKKAEEARVAAEAAKNNPPPPAPPAAKPAGEPVHPYRIKGVGGLNVGGAQVTADKDGVFMLTAAQVEGVKAHGMLPLPVTK